MKKRQRKLTLTKTTLRNLTSDQLGFAAGTNTAETNGCQTEYTDTGCTSYQCDSINEFTCMGCWDIE